LWAIFTGSLCWVLWRTIPFDVTDIGPLYVGSFKNADMIVADRRTKTFFQQSTFDSLIGPLHPHTLTMIPFQILPWAEVRHLPVLPQVCQVSADDFSEFQLPVPGVWRKIMASEATPGLPAKNRDKSFPARTHVIGVLDPTVKPQVVYLKREVLRQGIVVIEASNVILVGLGDAVNAFKGSVLSRPVQLNLNNDDSSLSDTASGTVWDVRGKYQTGAIKADLEMVAISDEYWFS
jgi:hypothetical protein